MIREMREWEAMMATPVSRERLAAWYSRLIQAGTAGTPRTGPDLLGFLEVAHFASAKLPSACSAKPAARCIAGAAAYAVRR